LLGNGDGSFQPPRYNDVGPNPRSLAVADVNGDGKPDIVVANFGDFNGPGQPVTSSSGSILLGNGDGTFRHEQRFDIGKGTAPVSVALADLNGDGYRDIIVNLLKAYNLITVLLNLGGGRFGDARGFYVGAFPSSVAVADVNGDGLPDLTVANSGDNTLSVLLGDGSGGFS